jgi:hypothetical protein
LPNSIAIVFYPALQAATAYYGDRNGGQRSKGTAIKIGMAFIKQMITTCFIIHYNAVIDLFHYYHFLS